MNEEQKYYIPEIEELHPGFEYEIIDDYEYVPEYKEIWVKKVLFEKDLKSGYWLEIPSDFNKQIRVKYLDKEDIESLGWIYIKTNPGFLCFSFQINKTTFTLEFNPRDNSTIICFTNKQQEKRRQHIFTGIIKNKSELSKLMKQLNII